MKEEIFLTHVHLETPLTICDGSPQLLIVESPTEFFRLVSSLDAQFDGGDGDFVFSRGQSIISPDKLGAMVSDLFHFDLNDKKLTSLLYKRLEEASFGDKLIDFNKLSAATVGFLSEIAFTVPFSLCYEEPQPVDYFKAAGLKMEKTYDSLEEKIICYVNALIELKKCEFFVFVNLKSVIDDEKLLSIYNHCESEKVGLLLIESSKLRPLLPCERAVIITDDLCEILENYI